jgi:hypothetical protein
MSDHAPATSSGPLTSHLCVAIARHPQSQAQKKAPKFKIRVSLHARPHGSQICPHTCAGLEALTASIQQSCQPSNLTSPRSPASAATATVSAAPGSAELRENVATPESRVGSSHLSSRPGTSHRATSRDEARQEAACTDSGLLLQSENGLLTTCPEDPKVCGHSKGFVGQRTTALLCQQSSV